MEEFIKNYIFSQIEPETPSNEINILSQTEQTSGNFGYSYVQCGEYIVFYQNSEPGITFYIYDKSMNLIKSEDLNISILGQTLKQDENGNFYLIGYVLHEGSSETVLALILLNNIITETPEIRKWYRLSSIFTEASLNTAFCQKKIGSASYLFFAFENNKLYIIEFNISVKEGNSVKKWVYSNYNSVTGTAGILNVGYQYNEETSKILIIVNITENYQQIKLRPILFNLNIDRNSTDTLTELTIANQGVEVDRVLEEKYFNFDQPTEIYVNGIDSFVFKRRLSNELVQYNNLDKFAVPIIAQLPNNNAVTFIMNETFIGTIEGTPGDYVLKLYRYEITENSIIISTNYITYNIDFQYDITLMVLNLYLINNNIYNLNYITFILNEIAGDGIAIIITTDDSLPEYINFNSLVPKYINVANGNVLFSRKLTNKSIIGNQMSAETNIPYSMINNTQISAEQLISETSKILSNETTIIHKNIYESLYLNFIKHINVIDNNFGKNELQNNISALLTKSIFSLPQANYDKAPIGYAKIFTTDGQELIFSIGENSIEQIGENEFLVSIAVNGNNADKLQILAKDKQTPYVTIPLYTVNKVILIKQKIFINSTFDNFIMSENGEFIITENNEFIIGG